MNIETMKENDVTSAVLPCLVLCQLQADLAVMSKIKDLPFKKAYNLGDQVGIEICLQRLEDSQYELVVKSAVGIDRSTDANLKKLVGTIHTPVRRALSNGLSRSSVTHCSSMDHLGADEIIALYECIDKFKSDTTMPFSFKIKGPRGSYELFSVLQKDSHFEIVVETNYIYGNAMKWKAEVETSNQAFDRIAKIAEIALGEWLKPGTAWMQAQAPRRSDVVAEAVVAANKAKPRT